MTVSSVGFMWECSCGHVEYTDDEPEECSECGKISSFIKMPAEIVEERMKEKNDSDDLPKKTTKTTKSKPVKRKK